MGGWNTLSRMGNGALSLPGGNEAVTLSLSLGAMGQSISLYGAMEHSLYLSGGNGALSLSLWVKWSTLSGGTGALSLSLSGGTGAHSLSLGATNTAVSLSLGLEAMDQSPNLGSWDNGSVSLSGLGAIEQCLYRYMGPIEQCLCS